MCVGIHSYATFCLYIHLLMDTWVASGWANWGRGGTPVLFFVAPVPRTHSHKESACQRRRHGFDPRVGKIPGVRQPTPVFLLESPMDRGAWWAPAVRGVAESQTWLSSWTRTCEHTPFYIPTNSELRVLNFPHPHQNLFFFFFLVVVTCGCEVVSHSFDLHFCND